MQYNGSSGMIHRIPGTMVRQAVRGKGGAVQFDTSEDLCKWVAEESNGVCLLSFSGGKDSWNCWLQLRKFFRRIIPVYMYLIPGLEFVENGLRQAEDVMGTHIYRMPHPALYRMLDALVFQPPERWPIIYELNLPQYRFDELFALVKMQEGLPPETYTAVGVRAVDNPTRWASVQKYGPLNTKRHQFYPIFDYRKDRVISELVKAGIKLPVDYKWFGRSFDGLDWRFLHVIKTRAPKDYARILEWFPLADLEVLRIQYREDYFS